MPPPIVATRKNGKLRYVHCADATFTVHVFGNLAGLKINEGERTRWYLLGQGSYRRLV